MRTKKVALNTLCDIIPYILIGIVGIIKVNVLVKYVGDVGNGYYQVINQIISYVFLAQAGFGDAVIYSLYKPFAEKNKDDINAIYSGARKIFKIIGLIIFGIICLVTLSLYLFYGFEDGYRNSALICFFVISSSYLIAYFGKNQTYMAVLSAAQEKYIYSLIFNIMKLICDILIVVTVMIFHNLESIAIVILIIKIIEEIVMRLVIGKKYSWLKEVEQKNTSMVKMTKDLVWVQVGYLILNNVDSLLLVSFIGPAIVSIYTTYNFIIRYLVEVSSRVEMGAVYSFGNVFAKKEDEKKVYSLFKEFMMLFTIIGFIFSLTFLIGIRSFVTVWIGKENYILDYLVIIFFSLTIFLNIIYYPLLALVNANGLFKDNKKHIFICAVINLVLSIALITPYGMNGILFGTAMSLMVNIFLKTKLISSKILKSIPHKTLFIKYILMIVIFIVSTVIVSPIEKIILSLTHGLVSSLLLIIITFILVTVITIGILYLTNDDTRKLLKRISNLLKRKSKKN